MGLSAAEPRQYCPAVSAILRWSAEDSSTPSNAPSNAHAALEAEVVAGWGPWAVDGGMRYEQSVLVGTAAT